MDEYQIGDLIEATVYHAGGFKRLVLAYVPDDEEDYIHWRALVPNTWPGGGWFADQDLEDIVPMVAVPRYSREQIVDTLAPECPDLTTAEDVADGVLRLMGQPVPEYEE